jgi:hypothetical protein
METLAGKEPKIFAILFKRCNKIEMIVTQFTLQQIQHNYAKQK